DDRNRSDREIGNRREIGQHVVERMFVESLILSVSADAAEHHCVAIRLCISDTLGTGHPAGAADVFHHDLLAEQLAHALRNNSTEGVWRSAAGERDAHRDWPCRETLGT